MIERLLGTTKALIPFVFLKQLLTFYNVLKKLVMKLPEDEGVSEKIYESKNLRT